jgi:hypothetical protein
MWIVGYCRFHFVGRLMSVAMTAEFVTDGWWRRSGAAVDQELRTPTDRDRPV